jgi:hypothetical protein
MRGAAVARDRRPVKATRERRRRRGAAKVPGRPVWGRPERDRPERDRPERDRPERDRPERDRPVPAEYGAEVKAS